MGQLINIHRAILVKELCYGNDGVLVEKILNVFKDVKNEEEVRKYLLSVPDTVMEFYKHINSLSLFKLREKKERWQNNIVQTIGNFLEQ